MLLVLRELAGGRPWATWSRNPGAWQRWRWRVCRRLQRQQRERLLPLLGQLAARRLAAPGALAGC
jgi:hypothetical protein